MEENELINKSEDKSDRIGNSKTIYSAGVGEIFWKNFLAGFARSLGGIFIYIIFLIIISVIFASFILPKITPLINGYLNIFNTMGDIGNPKSAPNVTLPKNIDILKIFGQ